jgi:hypothetical protein
MSRIVPSQVVAYIDHVLPESLWPYIGPAQAGDLAGLLSLTDQIPDELISMDRKTYSNFISEVSTIRSQLRIWEASGELVVRGTAPNLLRVGSHTRWRS